MSAAVSALAGAVPADDPGRKGRPRGRLPHIPAFDGIRAVAVIAVLLFHGGVSWMPGGALGVDVFFVLSGFLITALLVREQDREGRISLKQFYLRRIRRLLPALVLVLVFVAIVWGLLLKAKSPTLRGDALSTLFYVANWRFALTGQGYFDTFSAPSPLRHCWSLAVEEQFYLIWPLVVVLLISKRRSIVKCAYTLVGLAFLATLFQSLAGVWTDRLYYGTDTRIIPLLLGAAVGAWYARRPEGAKVTPRAKGAWQALGLAGAVGVAIAFTVVRGSSDVLYRGGFVLLAAAVAALLAAVAVVPRGWLAALLSWQPLRYIGAISYGVYLWHWPLFLLITHERTGLGVTALLFVRLAASVAVAMVSYHLLELPIRQRRWHLPKAFPKPRFVAPVALAALVGVLIAATPAPAPAPAPAPTAAAPVPAGPPPNTDVGSPAPPGVSRVLFVGDSMAVSLANALARSEVPYHVHIDNAGLLGCGIALGSPRIFRGTASDDPSFCKNWPQLRAEALAKDKPALSVALVGEWELMDRKRDGKWVHIGQPAYDAYLSKQLDLLISVMTSRGTPVALLTTPCRRFDESANGTPWPESSPARLDRFNQLVREAVARHSGVASVIDFKAMVCPGGKYVATLAGVPIRNADGIHFPEAAIPPIADKLLPIFRHLATT